MRYQVLEPFKVKTSKEVLELTAGQVITLPQDKAIKLISEGKVKPIMDIMDKEYSNLGEWLASYTVTAEEIKEILPEVYENIQRTIEDMDSKMVAEDLRGFLKALERVKGLYLQAVDSLKVKWRSE